MLAKLFKWRHRPTIVKATPDQPESVVEVTDHLHYSGFKIPFDLINMTGSGPDAFIANAEGQLAELRDKIGVEPDHTFVEIGCGVGRSAIPLTTALPKGRYLGIDIIERSIAWNKANISNIFPNFRFVRFDVKDDLHNPTGTMSTLDIKIPMDDNSVDRVIFWSVFTHLFDDEISHYLRECRRILKPGGKVWASCFVLTPEVLESARSSDLTQWSLTFQNEPDARGCFINNLDVPRGAVGYTPQALHKLISATGLTLTRPFVKGAWSGYHSDPESGQDGMILENLG
ncbi:hypothetical protein ASD00_36260 [Ensifer sp. Root31]|uniref:class I SAM-dependent methyltransferase n=1 Tax=Ensifer sp. Root31 TaxID=1736512 RepID=UPI00070F3A60|nr:class I SAM-dependent methyltransferase [Ensifer sp. Root31]KQU79313.1 hypothetical protein ASD00_36260 [Ensifer sp. Root31]